MSELHPALCPKMSASDERSHIINVSGVGMGLQGAKGFAELLHKRKGSVTHMNLSGCALGSGTTAVMAAIRRRPFAALQQLDLSRNGIRDKSMKAICNALKGKHSLEFVSLEENDFGDDGLSTLFAALPKLSLKRLAVSNNRFSEAALTEFLSSAAELNIFVDYSQSSVRPTKTNELPVVPIRTQFCVALEGSNKQVLVVDKPTGLSSQSSVSSPGVETALHLQGSVSKQSTVYLVHRLDKATSGLMCITLSSNTCAALQKAMRAANWLKVYLVLADLRELQGPVRMKSAFVDQETGQLVQHGVLESVLEVPERTAPQKAREDLNPQQNSAVRDVARTQLQERKLSKTEFWFLQTVGSDRALYVVRIHTGRTHQIRLHFSEQRLPLAGDSRYNGACSSNSSQRKHRLGLHCCRLRITQVEGLEKDIDLYSSPAGWEEDFGIRESELQSAKAAVEALFPQP